MTPSTPSHLQLVLNKTFSSNKQPPVSHRDGDRSAVSVCCVMFPIFCTFLHISTFSLNFAAPEVMGTCRVIAAGVCVNHQLLLVGFLVSGVPVGGAVGK